MGGIERQDNIHEEENLLERIQIKHLERLLHPRMQESQLHDLLLLLFLRKILQYPRY